MKHIVFFTGAGMSKASGLDTFRGTDGLWKRIDLNEYVSKDALTNNPKKVMQFYQKRKEQICLAEPNVGHRVIAKLEKSRYRVSVLTQNIDDLHERAGSTDVTHLHGNIMYTRSSDGSGAPKRNNEPLEHTCYLNAEGKQIFDRPDVVLFGEPIKDFEKAIDITVSADLFVIVGTTMSVQPAASLLLAVPFDCQVVYIDPEPEVSEGINLLVIQQTAEEGLRILDEELLPE